MKGSQLTRTGGEVDMAPPGKGKKNSKKKKKIRRAGEHCECRILHFKTHTDTLVLAHPMQGALLVSLESLAPC